MAYQFLASKRRIREQYRTLQVSALAAQGDGKEINKQLDAWDKEAD